MAVVAQELKVIVTVDDNRATKDLTKLNKSVDSLGQGFGKLGKTVKAAGAAIVAAGIAKAIIEIGKASVLAASDAEETGSKYATVFKDISEAAESTAESFAESFGLASTSAKQLLGDTGDLLTGLDFTQEAALSLSTITNELAVDLASFTNFSGGAEGASKALTSALLGEREAAKSLGIAIGEADIKRLAEAKGITGELDRQTKAVLTLELAIRQSKNAVGDFARTQDSFANQSRVAKENITELKEAIGNALVPSLANALNVVINPFIEGLTKWINNAVIAARATKVLATAQDEWARTDFLTVIEAQEIAIAKTQSQIGQYQEKLRAAREELALATENADEFGNVTTDARIEIAAAEDNINALNAQLRSQSAQLRAAKEGLSELDSKYSDINTEVDTTATLLERLNEVQIEATDSADDLADSQERVATELAKVNEQQTLALIQGEEFNRRSAERAVIQKEINALIKEGYTFESAAIQQLVGQYGDLLVKKAEVNKEDLLLGQLTRENTQALAEQYAQLQPYNEQLDMQAQKTEKLTANQVALNLAQQTYAGLITQTFSDLGAAIVETGASVGGLWTALAEGAKGAVATILNALAQQFAAQAAGALALGLTPPPLGNPAALGSAAKWTAAAGLASVASGAVGALEVPQLANGGIVQPTPGGTLANIAEAGKPEAVIPLDKLGGMGNTINIVNNNVTRVEGSIWQRDALFNAVAANRANRQRGF